MVEQELIIAGEGHHGTDRISVMYIELTKSLSLSLTR